MSEEAKYVLAQYVSGRDREAGYTQKSSLNATSIPEWLNQKTRASHVADEMPTRELQSYQVFNRENGTEQTDLALCHSVHVNYIYELNENNEIVQVREARLSDFTQSILLQEKLNLGWEPGRVSTMMELLMDDSFFWTPYNYQHLGENIEDFEVSARAIHEKYKPLSKAEEDQTLTEGNLSAFLARYWESCWARVKDPQNVSPLILVVTSPERNAGTLGHAVIPDGIRFFHDQVLPHLPENLCHIISVSFGCVGMQTNAQVGTACMVCYPEPETLNLPIVYQAFDDRVFDDQIDRIMLRVGDSLRKDGALLPSFGRLCSLDGGETMARNFELYYEEMKLECMLDDLNGLSAGEEAAFRPEEREEKRTELLEECRASLDAIRQLLRDNRFREDEITYVLFPLESRWAEACSQLGEAESDEAVRFWAKDFLSLDSRKQGLKESEIKALEISYLQYPALKAAPESLKQEIVLLKSREDQVGRNGEQADELTVSIYNLERKLRDSLTLLKQAGKDEERIVSENECMDGFEKLRKELAEYGFTSDEVTRILYRYELQWIKLGAAPVKDFRQALIRSWAQDFLSMNDRTKNLTEAEAAELEKNYLKHRAVSVAPEVIKQAIRLIRDGEERRGRRGSPDAELMTDLVLEEMNLNHLLSQLEKSRTEEERRSLETEGSVQLEQIRKELNDFGFAEEEITRILYSSELRWVEVCNTVQCESPKQVINQWTEASLSMSSRQRLLQEEEKKKLQHEYHQLLQKAADSRGALEALVISAQLRPEMDAETRKGLLEDLKALIDKNAEEHSTAGFENAQAAEEELKRVREIKEKLTGAPFDLKLEEAAVLLNALELQIPEWANSNEFNEYNDSLYRCLLDSAVLLKDYASPELAELKQAYLDALSKVYEETGTNRNPLFAILDGKYDSNAVRQYEKAACRNARNEGETVTEDIHLLTGRMLEQKAAGADELAEDYLQLILLQSDGKEDEILRAFIQDSSTWIRKLDSRWLRAKMMSLMQPMVNRDGGLASEMVRELTAWNEKCRPEGDELAEILVEHYCQQLNRELRDGGEIVPIIQEYLNAKSLRDVNPAVISGVLLERVGESDLEELCYESPLSTGLRQYREKDPGIDVKMQEVLNDCVENRRRTTGVGTGDIVLVLQAAEVYGIKAENIQKAIKTVLENTEDDTLGIKSRDALCDFADRNTLVNQPDSLEKSLLPALMDWASKTGASSVQENLRDVLTVAEHYQPRNQEQRNKLAELSALKVLPKADVSQLPDHVMMEKLFSLIGNQREGSVRQALAEWMEKLEAEASLYGQMDQLGIRMDEEWMDPEKYPKWARYYLDRRTANLADIWQERTVSDALKQARQPEKDIREFNRLCALVRNQEDGAEILEKQTEGLAEVLHQVVRNEESKNSGSALSAMSIVNELRSRPDEGNEFSRCICDAVFSYVNDLMSDDGHFQSAIQDRKALNTLYTAFREGQIDVSDPHAEQKKQAVDIAHELLGLYDDIARRGNVSEAQLAPVLDDVEANRRAFQLLEPLCLSEGYKLLQGESGLIPEFPQILRVFQSKAGEWRFDWMTFLNEVHPRSTGEPWDKADLLTDGDNTYGLIASLLNGMQANDLQMIQASFEQFLTASSFGRKAKARFKKQLARYLQGRANNPMLNWLSSGN